MSDCCPTYRRVQMLDDSFQCPEMLATGRGRQVRVLLWMFCPFRGRVHFRWLNRNLKRYKIKIKKYYHFREFYYLKKKTRGSTERATKWIFWSAEYRTMRRAVEIAKGWVTLGKCCMDPPREVSGPCEVLYGSCNVLSGLCKVLCESCKGWRRTLAPALNTGSWCLLSDKYTLPAPCLCFSRQTWSFGSPGSLVFL